MNVPRIVFLAGLPRSGSTLLANVLAQHSQICATATSPLCPLFETLRSTWSANSALLAQLDGQFEDVYERLMRSTRAFMETWSAAARPVTVDKHRGWLFCFESLRTLYPCLRMIVCLRDLRDVCGSLERQHRRTLMLTYPDATETNLVEARAAQYFSATGVVGGPLRAIRNLGDVPNPWPHLFVFRYEWFLETPEEILRDLQEWLELPYEPLATVPVPQSTHEADSYYRFKFPHTLHAGMRDMAEARTDLSSRVLDNIIERYHWFYRAFYRRDGVDAAALSGSAPPPRSASTPSVPSADFDEVHSISAGH